MKINKYFAASVATLAITSLALAPAAFADTPTATVSASANTGAMHKTGKMRMGMRPGVFGTVVSVSGNTITVSGKTGMPGGTTTTPITYTVDATNAKVMKANAASTVANIAAGDQVAVIGTLSGTNVSATLIYDGVMKKPTGTTPKQPINYPITGNGQPVVAGTISSITGSSIVVTNKSNITYTVDVSNAKIVEGETVVTVANMKVGDSVLVQGAVNGTTITASSVIDSAAQPTTGTGTTPKPRGFLGSIGSFFSHIFGF